MYKHNAYFLDTEDNHCHQEIAEISLHLYHNRHSIAMVTLRDCDMKVVISYFFFVSSNPSKISKQLS